VGVTAFEELGDVEEDSSESGNYFARRQGPRSINVTPRHDTLHSEAPEDANAAVEDRPSESPDNVHGQATQQQIDKLHKLQAALGRPAIVSRDLSTEEAARQISELVRIFNAQSRGGAKSNSR
jgi:hypothetical protein